MRKTKSAKFSDHNSIAKTVRFPKEEYAILQGIADSKNLNVSVLIRDCTLAHLQNTADHEELIESLGSKDPEKVQKNFFDILNRSNEAILKTMINNASSVMKKLQTQDALLRELMYLIMYFNREVPMEEKDARQKSALQRLKLYLEDFDKEHG